VLVPTPLALGVKRPPFANTELKPSIGLYLRGCKVAWVARKFDVWIIEFLCEPFNWSQGDFAKSDKVKQPV
jgi:hypothetical protein